MRISKFGIALRSLEKLDIEQVRIWRNLPHVQQAMIYQNSISPVEQKKWFELLDHRQAYFVIESRIPMGVCHVKNIDWSSRFGEAGIFIGEVEYLNSPVSIQAILALNHTFFKEFGFKYLTAKVRLDKINILNMNLGFGYRIIRQSEDAYHLKLDAPDFFTMTAKWTKHLDKFEKVELNAQEQKLFFP